MKISSWNGAAELGYGKPSYPLDYPWYGSLYHAKYLPEVLPSQLIDLDSTKDGAVHSVFAAGPTTNRTFFDDGRDAVDVGRAPCSATYSVPG